MPVPLKWLVNWENVVDGNHSLLNELSKDQHMVWSYALYSWYSFLQYDVTLNRHSIKVPYKIIVGENDLLFPPLHCQTVVEKLGGTNENLMVMEGGHFLPFNETVVFTEHVAKWFWNTLAKK